MLVTRKSSLNYFLRNLTLLLALVLTSKVLVHAFTEYDGVPTIGLGMAAIAETPGPPIKLVFIEQPSNALAQATISPAVRVEVEDANGIPVPTNIRVSLVLTGVFGLGGTRIVATRKGIATFSNLTVRTAGGYTLTATSPGLTAAVSSSFAISTSAAVSVSIVPKNINLTVSQGESFAATVSNSSNTAVTWSISPAVGTVSNGYYAPPASITTDQTVTVTATSVADPTKTATATIVLSSPSATSSTAVQSLGAIPATQLLSGLGFNIDPTQWEFELAEAAGTTHVRFQCGWINNESQTAPPLNQNTSTQYFLQPACKTALALSKQYGMHPTIIAGYGPPYHAILSVSVPGGDASGSKSINIQFASGVGGDTLQSLAPFYDTIIGPNNTQITSRNSYAGGLVTAVAMTDSTHATLTLASALTSALPANSTTQYTINEYLYPPAATSSPADPSVLAFANYAEFLAQSIASAGLTGEVEIWNEPVWSPDPWDDQVNFYDIFPGVVSPGPQSQGLPNWGFVGALQSQASPVSGVTYIWAGTNKSGDNSVLDPGMFANSAVLFKQPATVVTSESFHPYTNNPEDDIWSESCLESTINPYPAAPAYFGWCNWISTSTSNALKAAQETLVQKSQNPSWGIAHSITETGFALAGGDALHQARFIMRQFLGFQADGVTPIEFYRLYDTSSAELTFTDPNTQDPLPAYTAIAGLMSDIAQIKNAPVAQPSLLSSVVSFSGTYPLDTVHIVGSRPGDTTNSEIFAVWQQSVVGVNEIWGALPQPNAAPVTIAVPAGSEVSSVINLDTREAVSYTASGQQITFDVSDDPVEILVTPLP